MDNCQIHKSAALRELVEDYGCVLEFLPPYSPDFNPIEESFSCSMYSFSRLLIYLIPSVKYWMRYHWNEMHETDSPELQLLEACGAVSAEKAHGWFKHSGYI